MTTDKIADIDADEGYVPLFLREIAFQLSRANDLREEQWNYNREMDAQDQSDTAEHRHDSTNAIVATMKEAFAQMMGGFSAPREAPATPELLVEVSEHRDRLQNQLDATVESLGDMLKSQAAMVEVSLIPSIKSQIKDADAYIAKIQRELEAPADPDKPWVGRYQMSAACAGCARPSQSKDYSAKSLNVALTAEGWKRDCDGDWVCETCATALANASTESTVDPNKKESL